MCVCVGGGPYTAVAGMRLKEQVELVMGEKSLLGKEGPSADKDGLTNQEKKKKEVPVQCTSCLTRIYVGRYRTITAVAAMRLKELVELVIGLDLETYEKKKKQKKKRSLIFFYDTTLRKKVEDHTSILPLLE